MPVAASNSAYSAADTPPHFNPYDVFLRMLELVLQAPERPRWSHNLMIASLVFYVLVFFQAVYLLYQRYRINPQFKPKRNTLGLIVVDISYSSALVYIFYSPPTIYTLILSLLSEGKYQPRSSTVVLIFCLKFFLLVLGSWSFMSFCACQCAMICWNSDLASNVNRDWLQRLIKWVYNTFFMCAAWVPLPLMALAYAKAYKNLREIESIIVNLASMLRHQASAYESQTFETPTPSDEALQLATKLGPLRLEIVKHLRHGAIIYCIDTALLVVIFTPLLWISFRGLYEKPSPSENVEAALGSMKQVKKTPRSRKLDRDRRRLVSHALCVYVSTALHLPPLIIMLLDDFWLDFTRREIALHGLNDPLAVFANIILLILNVNSYQIIRAKKKANRVNPPPPPRGCSPDRNQPQQQAALKGLNDRSSERTSIALQDIHIALNNFEQNEKYHKKDPQWGICATAGHLHQNRPWEGCDSPVKVSIYQ